MYLLFDPAIPLLGIYPKDISQSKPTVYAQVYSWWTIVLSKY